MPVRKERITTIAKEASKCADKKETATGVAFCAEKRAMATTMIITKTNVIIFSP